MSNAEIHNYDVHQWCLCIVLNSGGPFQLMHMFHVFPSPVSTTVCKEEQQRAESLCAIDCRTQDAREQGETRKYIFSMLCLLGLFMKWTLHKMKNIYVATTI